jgi:hypothetical protein
VPDTAAKFTDTAVTDRRYNPVARLNSGMKLADDWSMDRVIRNQKNKRYLTPAGKWVRDRSRAQTFFFAEDARAFCLEFGIKSGVEGVIFYGTFETEFELFGK